MRSKRSRNREAGAVPDDELDYVDGRLLPLTAQLRADANRLATTYPPKQAVLGDSRGDSQSHRRPMRTIAARAVWSSAGIALTLFVGVGSYLLVSADRRTDDTVPVQSQRPVPQQAPSVLANRAESLNENTLFVSPVSFVSELSDPELEAWLDLRRKGNEEQIAF